MHSIFFFLQGAPPAEKLPFAMFEGPREFRPCDLQVSERESAVIEL